MTPCSNPSTRLASCCRSLLQLMVLAALQSSGWAQQPYPQEAAFDPPGRVARLNLIEGAVSFAPADTADHTGGNAWTPAQPNRPLTAGDRLWTGRRARSELHVGSTAVRMGEQTSLDISALDDSTTQLRLAQGTVQLRVRALFEGQRLEIDTPNVAFVISQPGNYRLDVDPSSDSTRVVAQSGGGTVYGDGGVSLMLGNRQQQTFSGTQLAPAAPGAGIQDSFDVWAGTRDRREDQSVSSRFIPRETIGYQQLDNYGDWQQSPAYGAVWLPRAVPVNWAPYRAGHWDWISPWGWTWVDDAPWGFAPFHYGRWAQIGPRWAWVPGQLPQRPVYAPALVAFVGGANWNVAFSSGGIARPALGWFPLAPGEAFRPAYRTSPIYVTQVNNNITVNNTVNVTNIYRYQRQPAAVTAASRDDFVRGRLIQHSLQSLSAADLGRAQLVQNHSAMLQRPEQAGLSERPRMPAAVPPAAVAAQAVVRSQGERGHDTRSFPNRADERRNNPDAGRSEGSERMPRPQALAPVAPRVPMPPVISPAPGALTAQTPAVRTAPVSIAPPVAKTVEAEQRIKREPNRPQQQPPRDPQRLQAEAVVQQQRLMQQRQAQMQQEAARPQALRQRPHDDALRPPNLPQQAHEQAGKQPAQQAQEHKQARPVEAGKPGQRPEGERQRNREP